LNAKLVEEIANAVLYEGYILYPYRASALKNRQRWNFGVLYPRAFSESQRGTDAWSMQTECLAKTSEAHATIGIRIRFLQLIERTDDRQARQEGVERDISVPAVSVVDLVSRPVRQRFTFPASLETEGAVTRKSEQLSGAIDAEAEQLGESLYKIRLRVFNTVTLDSATEAAREQALLQSLVSAHAILQMDGGEFISLLDPPDELREIAAGCKNVGTWPVLVGEADERDAMLSSPIILYDYPRIAPESAGPLFDGTEIDEILTLRIMTLTDEEKREMDQGDERGRQILQRTESMPPEQLMKMHGALRGLRRGDRETP